MDCTLLQSYNLVQPPHGTRTPIHASSRIYAGCFVPIAVDVFAVGRGGRVVSRVVSRTFSCDAYQM